MRVRKPYVGLIGLLLILLAAPFGRTGDGNAGAPASPPAPPPDADAAEEAEAEEAASPRVAVIRIEGMISDVILRSLQRRVEEAREAGVDVIVLEVDTYGGLVISALDISRYIKGITDARTLAWVNDKAYSAGALISLAADGLVMSPRSSIGDAAPIAMGQELGDTERAKIESPILEDFRDSAGRNGYPLALVEAMVRLGPEVYLIEDEASGERRYEWALDLPRFGLEPLRPVDTGGRTLDEALREIDRERERRRREREPGPQDEQPPQTPNPFQFEYRAAVESAADPGPSDAEAEDSGPADEPDAADAAEDAEQAAARAGADAEWRIVEIVNPRDTLLTLTQDEAVEHGFARAIIANEAELAEFLDTGVEQITRLDISWSEHLANWLTSPAVRGVLMLLLLLGAYMELQSPGLGLPGAVALGALIVLIGAPYLAGMAGVMDIILILLGMALILVEVFVLPGFGLPGLAGLLLLFGGLLMTFVQREPDPGWLPTLPGTQDMILEGALTMLISLLVAMVGIFFIARHFGSIPILSRLVLEEGGRAAEDAPLGERAEGGAAPRTAANPYGLTVGDVGRARTGLRPIGRADFNGQAVDVVTEGAWVEAGADVRIVEIRGNRVVVEKA